MEKVSYRLTTEVSRHRSARVVAWRGQQRYLPFFACRAVFQGIQMGLREKIEIVHVGDAVLATVGLVLGKLLQIPTAVTVHGLDITYPNRAYQALTPRLLSRFDAVIAVSRYTAAECVRRGVPKDRCYVIPNGVDPEVQTRFSQAEARRRLEERCGVELAGHPILLTTGRLIARKGVAHFVDRTLPLVSHGRPDVHYVVIGEGPERHRIQAAIRKHCLEQRVSLLGRVDDEMLWAAYQACDVFVMPNVSVAGDAEGFGLVALEAGLAERCVVAANLEGIRDAIDDSQNGILMPADDPSAQSKIIGHLLDNEALRHELGRRARQFVVEKFGWSRVVNEYLRVFDDIIRNGRNQDLPDGTTSGGLA